MPDYKEMYHHLMRATEKALQILIQAQRDCEEMYLTAPEPELTVLNPPPAGDAPSGGLLSLSREKVTKERA